MRLACRWPVALLRQYRLQYLRAQSQTSVSRPHPIENEILSGRACSLLGCQASEAVERGAIHVGLMGVSCPLPALHVQAEHHVTRRPARRGLHHLLVRHRCALEW